MKIETTGLNPAKPELILKAYLPEDSAKRPAILILPGGAYVARSKNEEAPVAEYFFRMGYAAFTLAYSTMYPSFNPDKWGKVNQGAIFPGPLLDLGLAVLKIKEKADLWRVDQEKLILCGFSAGGHLAASYLTGWHGPELAELSPDPEDFKISGAILAYAFTSFTVPPGSKVIDNPSPLFKVINGAFEPGKNHLNMRSPLFDVDEKTLPAFIWHTADDDVVPAENSLAFAAALAKENIPYELHIFRHGPHAGGLSQGLPGEIWPLLADGFFKGIF